MALSPFRFPSQKKTRIFLATVAAIALIGGVATLGTLTRSEAAAPSVTTPSMTVTLTQPRTESWPETMKATGAIAAWQEASIGTELSGQRLTELLVNVGDKVKKGQVLARFNTETLRAEEAQLRASFQQAEADRVRAVKLKGSDAMSNQQVLQYETTARIARAQLDAKEIQLRNAEVLAPDDGTISARSATLGAISSNSAELFRLICQDRLEWRGQVTADQVAHIAVGQKVHLTLPGGGQAEASVRQVSPAMDTGTRMATVYADVTGGSAALAGMFGEGVIEGATSDAITVPAVAVIIRDGHSYVFKAENVQGITKVDMVEVKVGRRQGKDSEILSGLKETDNVAVEGAGFLNDGDTVQIAIQGTQKDATK